MTMSMNSSFVDTAVFRYRSGYREINAFLAVPDTAFPAPAIVMACDIFGLDDHMKDIAVRFAQQGYVVLVPDFFTTKGGPGDITTVDKRRRLRRSMPDTMSVKDINSGFEYLVAQNYVKNNRIGVVGFGYGGTIALLSAANNRNIAACVNFYGDIAYPRSLISRTKPNSPIDMVRFINCPVLGLYGAPEEDLNRDEIQMLEQDLRSRGKPYEIKVYNNAANGFINDTKPELYKADAARDALLRTFNFLQQTLKR